MIDAIRSGLAELRGPGQGAGHAGLHEVRDAVSRRPEARPGGARPRGLRRSSRLRDVARHGPDAVARGGVPRGALRGARGRRATAATARTARSTALPLLRGADRHRRVVGLRRRRSPTARSASCCRYPARCRTMRAWSASTRTCGSGAPRSSARSGARRDTDLALLYDCIEPNLRRPRVLHPQGDRLGAARTTPGSSRETVIAYCAAHELSPLSRREALKNVT